MNRNFTKTLIALFFVSFSSLKAQQSEIHNGHNHEHIDEFYLPLEFDKDSLKGFNEEAAWQQAKMSTDQDWRQERIVAVLKRNFIDFKYGFSKPAPLPTVQGPCSNPDFENGTLSGWTATQGPNNNSLTMAGCCPNTTSQIVVVTPGADPNVAAIPRVPPGGGNFACRLGPTGTSSGGTSYRMAQSFTVTPANSVFIYKYAVLLNKAPHSCSEQPFFNVSFKDCNGNPIPCGQYNVTAIGTSCSSGDPTFVTSGSWAYKNWTTAAFDLTSYIGQCVNLEFTVAGCVASQGAHGGYAYIDASCSPMTLNLNGTDIPVGQTNNSFCGASTTNTLCAPSGFTYNWTGTGVTGQTGQCINTSSTGTYSVTLGIAGTTCSFSPVLYSTFNSVPNPTVTASLTQPVCALPSGTATMNISGGTGPYTYSWTPAAPSNSVNTNLPAGTSYTVLVEDDNGCTGTTSFSIDPYPPAPSYTLDVNPSYSLSCASPSTTITFAPTGTNTSVSWGGPSGTITGTNVVVTTPGTYTYSAINTVSTCSLTGSIVITSDVVLPSATYSTTCNTNTVTLTAAPASSTHTAVWFEPTSPPTALGNPASSTATGVFTLTVTDPSNGCVQTYTTLTSLPPISIATTPTTNVLTCLTTSVNANASSGPGDVITWNNGTSTVTTNPLPITTNGTYTAIATNSLGCSSQSIITVTTNTFANVSITSPTIIPCATGSLSLPATTPGFDPYTYSWSPSTPTFTGSVFTATTPGTYSVVATNAVNGCTTTASQTIVFDNITASFNASVYNGLMPLPVTFTNTSIFGTNPAGTNYSWSFGDGNVLASNDTTVTHVYNQNGNFPVILTAQNGFCIDTAVAYIKVDLISYFAVPNVFTPNGDGVNDVFTFDALNMGEIHVLIYDRWGLKMFESTATGNVKWDGKNKGGATVTDGTYFYIITATGLDNKTYDLKGTVNVFQ
ncbi:MAG: hypothetical protein C0448_03155 [Sphingobacteriaceae bacterium]|nr:hypothetical protein [Sphingobacteriaceae bacterium]